MSLPMKNGKLFVARLTSSPNIVVRVSMLDQAHEEYQDTMDWAKTKINSDDCTALELFNIKMYFGFLGMSTKDKGAYFERQMKEQELHEFMIARPRITQWPLGKHWYANIDGQEVTDEDGNNKWNTYERAYEVANNFKYKTLRKRNNE